VQEFLFPGDAENFPGVQELQSSIEPTPFADEYVPLGHSKQVSMLAAPRSLLYFPLSHGRHDVKSLLLYDPGAHAWQIAAPYWLTLPDEHGAHSLPLKYFPAKHASHAVDPFFDVFPDLQESHVVLRPDSVLYVFASHSLHPSELFRGAKIENLPDGHLLQSSLDPTPFTEEYVPLGQSLHWAPPFHANPNSSLYLPDSHAEQTLVLS
jgi:hypothetical protein